MASECNEINQHAAEIVRLSTRRKELQDALSGFADGPIRSKSAFLATEYERLHAKNRENDAKAELEVVQRKLSALGVDLEKE